MLARTARLADVLGYDAVMLLRLPAAEQEAVDWVAAGLLFAAVVVAIPMAYAGWLSTHQGLVAAAVGGALFALLLILLRLNIASSGRAPAAVMLVVSILAAQPAQLWLMREEANVEVMQQRAMLLQRHEAALRASSDGDSAAAIQHYREQLAQCDFVALRLQRVWSQPARAVQLTVLFLCLTMLPIVVTSALGNAAVRSYQRRCLRERKALIARDDVATRSTLQALLSAYPTYQAHASRGPLSQPWVVHMRANDAPEPRA